MCFSNDYIHEIQINDKAYETSFFQLGIVNLIFGHLGYNILRQLKLSSRSVSICEASIRRDDNWAAFVGYDNILMGIYKREDEEDKNSQRHLSLFPLIVFFFFPFGKGGNSLTVIVCDFYNFRRE